MSPKQKKTKGEYQIERYLLIIGGCLVGSSIGLFVWLTHLEASKVITDCVNASNTIVIGGNTLSFPVIILALGAFCMIGQYLPGLKKWMKG